MGEATAKEKILKDIREALTSAPMNNPYTKIDLDENLTIMGEDYPDALFAENFVASGGKLVYCENLAIAVKNLRLFALQEDWNANIYCPEEEYIGKILSAAGLQYSSNKSHSVLKKILACSVQNLVAQTGSILFNSSKIGRRAYMAADTIIFFAAPDQIAWDYKECLEIIRKQIDTASSFSIWTGLSSITDIDQDKRRGLGPNKILLFLIGKTV